MGCRVTDAASACLQGAPPLSVFAAVRGGVPSEPAEPALQPPTLPSAAPAWLALLIQLCCSASPRAACASVKGRLLRSARPELTVVCRGKAGRNVHAGQPDHARQTTLSY